MSLWSIQSANICNYIVRNLRSICLKIMTAFISTLVNLILYFREAKARTGFYWLLRYNMPFRQMEPWLFVLTFLVNILCALVFPRRRSTIIALPQSVDTFPSFSGPLRFLFGGIDEDFCCSLRNASYRDISAHQQQSWTEGAPKSDWITSTHWKAFYLFTKQIQSGLAWFVI